MNGDILQVNGFCKVCPGVVPITLDNANTQARIDSWLRNSSVCASCGTWFRATDVIDQYEIIGEASEASPQGYTRDYHLERQPSTRDDLIGCLGIVQRRMD
jgi:hypothetical protein